MSSDYLKEKIKFETEKFRLYFILFLADISGTIALINNSNFGNSTFHFFFAGAGFIFSIIFVFLLVNLNFKIKKILTDLELKEKES